MKALLAGWLVIAVGAALMFALLDHVGETAGFYEMTLAVALLLAVAWSVLVGLAALMFRQFKNEGRHALLHARMAALMQDALTTADFELAHNGQSAIDTDAFRAVLDEYRRLQA